jgi:Na+/melibiose symporter-like transporter
VTLKARKLRITGFVLVVFALAAAAAPLLPSAEDLPVAEHHLAHGVILAIAAAGGICFATARTSGNGSQAAVWLFLAVFMPLLSMFLMWPTTYDWLERHTLAHVCEHIGFVAIGFCAGYSGERYVAGVGWVSGIANVLTAIVAAAGFGIVRGSR